MSSHLYFFQDVFYNVFKSLNRFFSTSKIIPGTKYGRTILKKVPGVSLNGAQQSEQAFYRQLLLTEPIDMKMLENS